MSHQGQVIIIISPSVPLSCSGAVAVPLNTTHFYRVIKNTPMQATRRMYKDQHSGNDIDYCVGHKWSRIMSAVCQGGCRVLLTYCGYEGGVEGVLAESEQQTCLADAAVSDEQQLEQIIVRLRHLHGLQTPTYRHVRPYWAGIPRLKNHQPPVAGQAAERCRNQWRQDPLCIMDCVVFYGPAGWFLISFPYYHVLWF